MMRQIYKKQSNFGSIIKEFNNFRFIIGLNKTGNQDLEEER